MKKLLIACLVFLSVGIVSADEIVLTTPVATPTTTTCRFTGMIWDIGSKTLVVTYALGYMDGVDFVAQTEKRVLVKSAAYTNFEGINITYSGSQMKFFDLFDKLTIQYLKNNNIVQGTIQ